MKVSSKIFLAVTIMLLSCLVTTNSGSSLDFKLFYPQKDAFIDSSYPSINFGYHKYLIGGNVEGEGEKWIFIFFDFTSVPQWWEKAELYLNFEDQTNLYPILIEIYTLNLTYWNEGRITWKNKPNLGNKLVSTAILPLQDIIIPVDQFLYYTIFSICLKVITETNLFISFYSDEYEEVDLRPHLRFSYEVTGPQKLLGMIGIVASFGILGLIVNLIYFYYAKYLKKKEIM